MPGRGDVTGGVRQRARRGHRGRHRLLQEQVLAGLRRLGCHHGLDIRGDGEGDGLHVSQQGTVVVVRLSAQLLRQWQRAIEVAPPDADELEIEGATQLCKTLATAIRQRMQKAEESQRRRATKYSGLVSAGVISATMIACAMNTK